MSKAILTDVTLTAGRIELPAGSIVERCTFLSVEVAGGTSDCPTLATLRARHAAGDPKVTKTAHGYRWVP